MTNSVLAAGALIFALAAPALAQGNSGNAPGKNGTAGNASAGKGQGKGAAAPPSQNTLASVATVDVPAGSGATPIAWVDDASVLDPGVIALSMSAVRWSGGGLSETYLPVANAGIGLTRRLQLSASVPRALASSDLSGSSGGVSTSFFSLKAQVFADSRHGVKVAVSPTLQVLGEAVAASLSTDASRTRFGLPVSAELDHGPVRLYGGGGYFSPGLWYTGAAVAAQTAHRLTLNVGISHAWKEPTTATTSDALPPPARNELSGGAAYAVASHVIAFGSVGQTFATLDENGAGTTLTGGVMIWFAPR